MRSKSLTVFSVGLLLLGALVSSCSRYPDSPSPVVRITLPLGASTASVTPAPASPTTTLLQPTPSATAVPSKTPFPPPTPTPTNPPTLTKQEGEPILLELFKTNGNCSPPCFWGIVPGKTTLEEAEGFFQHLGRSGNLEENSKGEINHYDTGISAKDGYLKMELELEITRGIVERIQIYLGGFFEPSIEPSDWEAYNLRNILKTYGVPSRVVFTVDYPHEPSQQEGKVLYSYWLYFEESNLMVFYPGDLIGDASNFHICPLNPSEEPTHMYMIFGEEPAPTFEGWVDLLEASKLTYEDFYHRFTEGDENTCIALLRAPFLESK